MQVHAADQVRESFFDKYYYPYKAQIWAVSAAIVITAVGILAFREYKRGIEDEQWDRYGAAVRMRAPTLPGEADADTVRSQVDLLKKLIADFPDGSVAPFAQQAIVDAYVASGEHDKALSELTTLRAQYKDFAINALPASANPQDDPRSLAEKLEQSLRAEKEWQAETTYEHAWPSDDRIALVETTEGSFWIGFYSAESPARVEAFVERAKSGAYNGTQVYEIRQDATNEPALFRAGSLASRAEADPTLHDRDEPLDTLEPEDGRFRIRHVYRAVSSVEMSSGDSATRFMVVTAKNGLERYDGQNTVFAAVLDREGSLETIDRIGRALTYGTNPETAESDGVFRVQDHPYPYIYIRRVTVWSEEDLEDGHTWIADDGVRARVATAAPEPWEADLKPPPKPADLIKTDDGDAPGLPKEDDEPDDDPESDDPERDDEAGDDDGSDPEDDTE